MLNDIRVGYSLAFDTLKRGNKKTTALIIFVLTLIFINLVFSPAVINGMTSIFTEAVVEYSYGDIIIEPSENNLYIEETSSLISKIDSINGVVGATKRLTTGASFRYKEKLVGSNIIGIVPEKDKEISKFDNIVAEGDFLTSSSSDEIMLGRLLAGKEGGPEIYDDLGGVSVGTRINITFSNSVTKSYKIKGIHEGGPEISDLIALINFNELEKVLGIEGQDKASNIIIKIRNPEELNLIKQKILETGIKENVYTWEEKIQDIIKDIMDSFGTLTIVTKIISIIIAVFVLFIVIYINTLNKIKQIGILKAIGITPSSIIISYVLMSLFYTVLGIFSGIILLFLLVLYFQSHPITFYESIRLVPRIDYNVLIQSVFSLLITSLVAGFIPAWLAARKKILEAIWGR